LMLYAPMAYFPYAASNNFLVVTIMMLNLPYMGMNMAPINAA
jgi:hypothetical protein